MGRKVNLTPNVDKDDLTLIYEVKKFISDSDGYYSEINKRIEEDFQFYSDEQYNEKDKTNRGEGRNQSTFNVLRRYVHQITNQYNDNKFGIKLSPKKIESVEKAKLAESIINGIEVDSRADDVYSIAHENQVICGYGYIVVTTDYAKEDSESFDQQIKIIGVQNPSCVKFGNSEKIDGSDVNEATLIEFIDESIAEDLYGKDVTENNEYSLNSMVITKPEDTTMMVTYYKKRFNTSSYYKLADGRSGPENKFTKLELKGAKKRTIKKPYIEVSKIIGHKVISRTELPIKYIPIIPVYGTRVKRKQKWQYIGIIDSVKDCQKFINYAGSLGVERVAHSIRPVIAADFRGIGEHEEDWRNINKNLSPTLFFNGLDTEGNAVPMPTVLNQATNISDVLQTQGNMEGLISSILGIPKDGIGQTASGQAETAEAVLTRSRSSDRSYAHYFINLAASIEQVGRVVLELLNVIYDTPREMTFINGKQKEVKMVDIKDIDIISDELEVSVEAGPMSVNARRDSLNQLLAFAKLLGPESLPKLVDKLFLNSDVQDAEELANRFKYIDPNAMTQETSGAPIGQDPSAVQALTIAQQALATKSALTDSLEQQLTQAYSMITQLQTAMQSNAAKLQADIAMNDAKLSNNLQLEAMKEQAEDRRLAAKLVQDAQTESQSSELELKKLQQKEQERIDKAQQFVPDVLPTEVRPQLHSLAKGGLIS